MAFTGHTNYPQPGPGQWGASHFWRWPDGTLHTTPYLPNDPPHAWPLYDTDRYGPSPLQQQWTNYRQSYREMMEHMRQLGLMDSGHTGHVRETGACLITMLGLSPECRFAIERLELDPKNLQAQQFVHKELTSLGLPDLAKKLCPDVKTAEPPRRRIIRPDVKPT